MYHSDGEKILQQGAEVIRTDRIEIPHLCDLVQDVQGIVLRAPAKVTKEVIDANPYLKVISGAGVGLDNIDVEYATTLGIPVLHAPAVNKTSTAEHAVMLMLALAKSVLPFHEQLKKGNYNARMTIPARELKGKKVGLIGFGHIAQEVAKILKLGFEMDVTAWVRTYKPEKHQIAQQIGIHINTNLEEVFKESDYISIHLPLTAETRMLIDQRLLSIMKPSACLINTARGAIIHQEDLYNVLKNGKIRGAGLDVFDPEPPDKNLPLLSLPNIIVTPHVGGTTVESNQIMASTVATNVLKTLQGLRPQYIANPEVLNDETRIGE